MLLAGRSLVLSTMPGSSLAREYDAVRHKHNATRPVIEIGLLTAV